MFLVCRYIDHQEQAEEVLNNGFLKAFKRISQYDFKGSFEGWLRKVMFRCVSDYVKQNSRYSDNVVLVEKDEYIDKDHADKLYYNQLLELVQSLPESARTVFNLSVMEGFSHKEISKLLNISEGTSKWHLSEARKQLKEKIEKLDLQYKS